MGPVTYRTYNTVQPQFGRKKLQAAVLGLTAMMAAAPGCSRPQPANVNQVGIEKAEAPQIPPVQKAEQDLVREIIDRYGRIHSLRMFMNMELHEGFPKEAQALMPALDEARGKLKLDNKFQLLPIPENRALLKDVIIAGEKVITAIYESPTDLPELRILTVAIANDKLKPAETTAAFKRFLELQKADTNYQPIFLDPETGRVVSKSILAQLSIAPPANQKRPNRRIDRKRVDTRPPRKKLSIKT